MKFNSNKITIIMALILSGLAFYSFNKKNENRLATGLDISILPSKDSYLSKDSIRSILNPFLGDEKKSIDLNLIENIVDNNSYVDKSEVSLSFSGNLVLKIKQKTPVGRVISENEMYNMFSNIFSISNNIIISDVKFSRLNNLLITKGYNVETISFSETSKMGGLFRCATLPLERLWWIKILLQILF